MSVPKQFLATMLVFLLAGCTQFPPLDQRGATVNQSAGDYANEATLLNIIRASRQEPLTFIAITGLSGTDSLSGTLGFPSIGLGPTAVTSPRNYIFGPNSATRSNSGTFQFAVIDDPASYAGLMAPTNPAILAYLMQQYAFSRPLLFFLLTSEIQKTNANGTFTYVNDPNDKSYLQFVTTMASLMNAGLIAQVDATAFPSGKTLPASRLCFDPTAPLPEDSSGTFWGRAGSIAVDKSALCDSAAWTESDVSQGPASGGSGDDGPSSLGITHDGSLWLKLSKSTFLRVAPDGKIVAVKIPETLLRPDKPASPAHLAAFKFSASGGETFQISFRSTLGAYYYIGAFLDGREKYPVDNLLPPDAAGSGAMIDVTKGQNTDCFVQASYRGTHYCVPQDAGNTKKLITLLHLLQQLETAPSNTPTTLTITGVP